MQQLTGKVESFNTSEAKKSTKGFSDYFSHVYTINGLKFSKFGKTSEPEVQVGSEVSIIFESKQSGKKDLKGEEIVYRNIDSITALESTESTTTSKTGVTGSSETSLNGSLTNNIQQIRGSITAKDLAIIRQNAVSSAISLLSGTREAGDLKMALVIANKIVEYTSAPYLDSSIVNKLNKG